MSREEDIQDCIYNNSSVCGETNKPLTEEDRQFLPKEIRKEDNNTRLDELAVAMTWQTAGGTGKGLYPKIWTSQFRRSIKRRDNFTCFICKDEEKIVSHHIHHIDYDKDNCDESNLITLCPSCHLKTNKNREQWEHYFEVNLNGL